jgi:hypothetical protein
MMGTSRTTTRSTACPRRVMLYVAAAARWQMWANRSEGVFAHRECADARTADWSGSLGNRAGITTCQPGSELLVAGGMLGIHAAGAVNRKIHLQHSVPPHGLRTR